MIDAKIKRRLKKFIVPVLFRSGYYSWILRKGEANRCLILMYHRIYGDQDSNEQEGHYGIGQKNFEKQMQFLHNHMTPIPLSMLAKSLQKNISIPSRAVVVTFDDGYADNYFNAYPTLKKYRIPATIFLTTGYINTNKRFWWDRLRMAVRQNPLLLKKNSFLPPSLLAKWFSNKPQELTEALITYIWRNQNMCPDQWISLLGKGQDAPPDDQDLLTWEQVQEMSRHDLDFGSHTVSHPNMVHLSSPKLEEELRVSKQIIETRLGRMVEGFAYPIGRGEHYNNRIKQMVQKVGFKYACTAQVGCVYPQVGDMLCLKRIPPPDSLPYFVRDLSHYMSVTSPTIGFFR